MSHKMGTKLKMGKHKFWQEKSGAGVELHEEYDLREGVRLFHK